MDWAEGVPVGAGRSGARGRHCPTAANAGDDANAVTATHLRGLTDWPRTDIGYDRAGAACQPNDSTQQVTVLPTASSPPGPATAPKVTPTPEPGRGPGAPAELAPIRTSDFAGERIIVAVVRLIADNSSLLSEAANAPADEIPVALREIIPTPQLVCITTAEALNARAGPSTTSLVIMTLQQGARLEPLARAALTETGFMCA